MTSPEDRKRQEIAWCWDNQPDDYDWTSEYDRYEEEQVMWKAYEASQA
jgi:hypothetical protein